MAEEERAPAGGQTRDAKVLEVDPDQGEGANGSNGMRGEDARAQVGDANVVIPGVNQTKLLEVEHEPALLIELAALISVEAVTLGEGPRWRVDVVERLRDQIAQLADEDVFQILKLLL